MLPIDAQPRSVLNEIMPLLTIIYEVVEAAIQEAIDYFSRNREEIDGWCFSSLVRYRIKVALNRLGYVARNEDESEDEGKPSPLVGLRLEGADVNTTYLMNNGLLLDYKGYRIRILKRHRRNLLSANADPNEFQQMNLDFGWVDPLPQNLLVVWCVGARYQLVGLELIKPLYDKEGPARIEWSARIPHPAELIEGDSFDDEYMYNSELPILMGVKVKIIEND